MKLKINFVLKTGIDGEIPILAIINFGYKEFDALKSKYIYKPLKYYTGIKVARHDWDDILKQPIPKNKLHELLKTQRTIEEAFQYLQMRNEVSNDAIKNHLDIKLKGKSDDVVTKVRLVDFIQKEFISREAYSDKTKIRFSSFVRRIEAFELLIRKPLYSNDVNEQLYAQFMEESRNTLKKQNSIWLLFADFRTVMRRIAKTYKISVFVPTHEISSNDKVRFKFEEKIYLNFEQIQKILNYEPPSERMLDTKLILMKLLFTGCRYSDVFKVKPEFSYDKDGVSFEYTRFITQKRDVEVIIPILKPLREMLEQNVERAHHRYSEAGFNLNVKELARQCGMDEPITLSYTDSRGKKQFETKPFYQFVSSHTGRRSFITNLINYVPVTILTKITSHQLKDASIIFGYNKITLLENAVLFVKELCRLQETNKDHFRFQLI